MFFSNQKKFINHWKWKARIAEMTGEIPDEFRKGRSGKLLNVIVEELFKMSEQGQEAEIDIFCKKLEEDLQTSAVPYPTPFDVSPNCKPKLSQQLKHK